MPQTLDEILSRLNDIPETQRAVIAEQVIERSKDEIWLPNIGPQSDAYFSKADLLLYGGQGGGGKTDLIAGLALTQHQRTLLLRPQYTDLGALIERVVKIAGTRKGLNSAPPAQFKFGHRVIDFGAAAKMDRAETWQGNPHDLLAFDEACLFTEEVVRFLMGWNRAADEHLGRETTQRVRTIMASNPPLGSEGEWIIGMFRPWLDITHPNPAKPGELRFFITYPDGNDKEVDNDTPIEIDGTKYVPKSRTFIPAALKDNPFLIDTGYQATLDAMPEPLRSAIRDGNFMAAREDDEWQVIPTQWLLEAQNRWREGKPNGITQYLPKDMEYGLTNSEFYQAARRQMGLAFRSLPQVCCEKVRSLGLIILESGLMQKLRLKTQGYRMKLATVLKGAVRTLATVPSVLRRTAQKCGGCFVRLWTRSTGLISRYLPIQHSRQISQPQHTPSDQDNRPKSM